jgi:RNA polymerase sigma-70 factor, ECF subfamily
MYMQERDNMKKSDFPIIISKYKDMIYTQAFYFTGNEADAADITQDVLLKVWTRMNHLRKQGLKQWLLTVTRHRCIDMTRKSTELLPDGSARFSDKLEGLACFDTPESDALHRDLKRHLEQALLKLPKKIRYAMILYEIQNFKYREIATTMDIPVNSVKVYIHRGKKMLTDIVLRSDALRSWYVSTWNVPHKPSSEFISKKADLRVEGRVS